MQPNISLVIVSPSGVIQITNGKEVVYQDVINVTCKEKQMGKFTPISYDVVGLVLTWLWVVVCGW